MDIKDILEKIKDLFTIHDFETLEEYKDEGYVSFTFMKKDFRVEVSFDSEDNDFYLQLDRPFFEFTNSDPIQDLNELENRAKGFISKIEALILEDDKLKNLTTKDCELFLKTGSYDGMASGVIEYEGQLYYIETITNAYLTDKSKEDRQNRVWRRFYVFELNKTELEKIVMNSLDWMRHINLTSLCKNWQDLRLTTADESEKDQFFRGKYRYSHEPKNKPVMRLTIHY
jgi:hypothetical protein